MATTHHRLPGECYQGQVSVAFTLCISGRKKLFTIDSVVVVFVAFLKEVAEKHQFRAIYCFMPDHLHFVAMGRSERSNVLSGLEDFKQLTGYWLKHRVTLFRWQKGFHDRILRSNKFGPAIRYVLDNPVRKQLVREWRDYPFMGAIGMDLETFLTDLVEL
jgi:REP element-mobilizing transposase RayT